MVQFLLLLLCVGVFSFADYLAARWGHTNDSKPLALALLVGPCAYLLFGRLAASGSLTKLGAYVNSGIVLATTAFGVLLLSERPSRLTWVALAIIVVGLALLGLGRVQRGDA